MLQTLSALTAPKASKRKKERGSEERKEKKKHKSKHEKRPKERRDKDKDKKKRTEPAEATVKTQSHTADKARKVERVKIFVLFLSLLHQLPSI